MLWVLILSPLLDVGLVVLDPILDPVCEGIARGVVTVMEAYEKTQPPTGPVYKCHELSCAQRFSKCPNYHPFSDCAVWIEDKSACDGKCNKYHRKWVGGRGLSDRAKAAQKSLTFKPPIFIPEQPIFGKVTLGLRWDINPDKFDESGVFCAIGDWEDVNLGVGIFNLNGELLYMVYPDDDPWNTSSNKDKDHFNFAGGIIHHNGNDKKGGPEGRKKPGNFGNNEAIHIDFDRMPENVGAIVVSIQLAHSALRPRLENCKVSILSTPSFTDEVYNLKVLEVDLERNGELKNQTGYIFGKFVRTSAGFWKFIPIQAQNGLNSSESVIQQLMKPYAQETTTASLPGPLESFEIRTISLTKDRKAVVPIKKVGFVCFDVFGKRMEVDEPFYVMPNKDGEFELKFKGNQNKTLRTIFVYVEHQDQAPVGVSAFVVGADHQPIICNVSNIGANAQLVAKFLQISEGEVTRWEVSTYSTPIKNRKQHMDDPDTPVANVSSAVAEIAYAQRLLPEVGSQLSVLLDLIAPNAKNLVVQVLSGNKLAVKDMLSSDPFVVVKFGQQKFKTDVVKNTVNPNWNATFKFEIDTFQSSDTVVRFRCKDWNKVTKYVSMGIAKFDLMDFLNKNMKNDKNGKITLQLEKDPKHPKQEVSGHIVVNIFFE